MRTITKETKSIDQESPNPYELPEWECPPSYGGFSPDGDFCLYATNRDADVLTDTNWKSMCEVMDKWESSTVCFVPSEDEQEGLDEYARIYPREVDLDSFVYIFRAGHWAVGWVEYLMLRRDAPDHLQKEAYELLGALETYPVLDDEAFSQAEMDDQDSSWESWIRGEVERELRNYPAVGLANIDMSEEFEEIHEDFMFEQFGSLEDKVDDDDIELRELFEEAAEEAGADWEMYSDGSTIRYEDVIPYLVPRIYAHIEEMK